MTYHHDDRFHATIAKIVDTAFDHGLVAERKQRLESPHPARLSSGEENCCYVIHSES
jgi:hypothetical protein